MRQKTGQQGNNENTSTKWVNPLTINVHHHIEISQLIRKANQLTGFYVIKNIDG